MGMITGVGRLLRGLWGLMFGCVRCLSVGPGLLLLGLGPEEQSHSAGKPDTSPEAVRPRLQCSEMPWRMVVCGGGCSQVSRASLSWGGVWDVPRGARV